ncbi:hypothetical protein D9M71_187550 [compost metagenome]
MPLGHELRHYRLGAHLRMPHRQRPAAGKRLHQLPGQYQVAQAQRREGNLAEGPDVQHPPGTIQCRERRQWVTAVAVLAVVVVLDDPAVPALGPGQQFQASGQAHGDPGRVLVGRRHVTEAAMFHGIERCAVQTFVIHPYTLHLCPGQREGIAGGTVTGVFHSNYLTRLQ